VVAIYATPALLQVMWAIGAGALPGPSPDHGTVAIAIAETYALEEVRFDSSISPLA